MAFKREKLKLYCWYSYRV